MNIERVTILMEYFSFWLAAPELVGDERLEKAEEYLESGMKWLSVNSRKITDKSFKLFAWAKTPHFFLVEWLLLFTMGYWLITFVTVIAFFTLLRIPLFLGLKYFQGSRKLRRLMLFTGILLYTISTYIEFSLAGSTY